MNYPVHERFYTFQGEGAHMGKASFFVRLFGCPVHCPFCDSAGTWHPDFIPGHVEKISSGRLVEEAQAVGAGMVVVTGGEPTIHDLRDLVNAFHDVGIRCHLETSGAFPIKGFFDWITLSPKRWRMPLKENIREVHEFKIIVERPEDIDFYLSNIVEHLPVLLKGCDKPPAWLHPEWSQRSNPDVLKAIINAVKAQHDQLDIRAGWQLHKLYNVDAADARSRPLVPLGGNPANGF